MLKEKRPCSGESKDRVPPSPSSFYALTPLSPQMKATIGAGCRCVKSLVLILLIWKAGIFQLKRQPVRMVLPIIQPAENTSISEPAPMAKK